MSQDGMLKRGGQVITRKVQKHVKMALKCKADEVLDRVSKHVKHSVHDILGP